MSVSQELISTQNCTDWDKMIKVTQHRYNSLRNHGLFKYSMFSDPGAIIGNLATFEG